MLALCVIYNSKLRGRFPEYLDHSRKRKVRTRDMPYQELKPRTSAMSGFGVPDFTATPLRLWIVKIKENCIKPFYFFPTKITKLNT